MVRTKVQQWLKAGTRLVWVIDPRQFAAHVYRADGTDSALTMADALSGEGVLPRFMASVESLIAD